MKAEKIYKRGKRTARDLTMFGDADSVPIVLPTLFYQVNMVIMVNP